MNIDGNILSIIFCTVAIFGATILCLAATPHIIKRIIGRLAFVTAIFGLLFYSYGYGMLEKSPIAAVFQAIFAVFRMFVGSSGWDDIGEYIVHPAAQIIFWVLHLMGLFTSASAAITALGSGLMRKLRLWIFRWRDITLIYCLNKKTLAFAQELIRKENASVLFVDSNPENPLSGAVDQAGAILRTDSAAVQSTAKFLRSMGLRSGKRKIHVYVLSRDLVTNQQYAAQFLESMKAQGLQPQQSTLTILGPDDEVDHRFQATADRYGYGSVMSVNEAEMAARMLIRQYPPCDTLTFRKDGSAAQDFHAILIGFGHTGQAVAKQLVMNGQFQGSHFRLDVFDPDYENKSGRLFLECSPMFSNYDIRFHPYDGRSRQIYTHLSENAATVRYVAICTGKDNLNLEIAEQLRTFLHRKNADASIYICSTRGVGHHVSEEQYDLHRIYTPEILCSDQVDQMAMVLNQYYTGSGDIRENWKNCGYFNRMSSRASADFSHAQLYAASVTAQEAKQHWAPEGDLLENLSITEHLRWEAFHYCMGFRPMTDEEFETRAAAYRAEKAVNPDSRYRITRDMDNRIHACMIPWEALDAYSEKENAITGGHRDYQENDRINVRAIADVLRAMDEN